MYSLYSAVLLLFAALSSPSLAYKSLRHRKYVGTLRERMGVLPPEFNAEGAPSIWVHAVSVGELLAARPMIAALRARHPGRRMFVSTTTRAAQELAKRNVTEADGVFYCPFDLQWIVRRTLRVIRPELLVIVETDLWPHLLRECHARGVRTAFVNARLSSRSFPRYRRARGFFRHVLSDIDRFCVQSDESAERFTVLGAESSRITVTGSLKFDARSLGEPAAGAAVLQALQLPAGHPLVVAGSTMPGEEAIVLRAFRQLKDAMPSVTLLLAPRHPERFSDVVRQSERAGFRTVRRTALPTDGGRSADVIVLDTIGELATAYQLATLAFVGGSLVPTGGHNLLEPAASAKAMIFGPHMRNFREIAALVVQHAAGVQVADEAEFVTQLLALMADGARRATLGAAALALVERYRGANDRTLRVLDELLPTSVSPAA